MATPKISVLVPIYNVERYIKESLDSLRAQTMSDFEVICINDGSTDSSRQILQRYLDEDARFKVIDKENSGYGASMNRGLDETRGEFVAILEPDDLLEPNAFELLVSAAERVDAQVAKADFNLYWSTPADRREPFGFTSELPCGEAVSPRDYTKVFYLKPSIWSAIYRRDYLQDNNIRFTETPGASYQDASFNFKVWAMAKRVVFLRDIVLNYRQDNEQSSVNSPAKAYCVCDEYDEMEAFLAARPTVRAELEGIKERMKFDTYLWNYDRLTSDLKTEFMERAADEFRADMERGDVDLSLFEVWAEADLRALLDSPEVFAECREKYLEGGKLSTFMHYFKIGGMPLIIKVLKSKKQPVVIPSEQSESRDHPQDSSTSVLRASAQNDEAANVTPDEVTSVIPHDSSNVIPSERSESRDPASDDTPLITVVVPVYNVADYLEESLASLRHQTLENIEIVAVNDGSTDESREILTHCADLDPRIVIIDKENGGLSSARNAGIAAARAPYVCFLDSDDRFEPNACERIVRAFEEGGERTDVVTFGAICYPKDAEYPWLVEHLSPRDIAYEGFAPPLLFKEMSRPFAWRTACRTNFLRDQGIVFDESVLFGEDQVFHFAIYPRARKTLLVSDKLYDYRVAREGSLMAKVASDPERKMAEHVNIMDVIFDDWQRTGFLDEYASPLIAEYVDFALFGILGLSDEKREELRSPAAAVLTKHLSEQQLAGIELAPATRKIVDAFLRDAPIPKGKARRLRLAYHKQQYGMRSVIGSVLRRG